jgi:Zn-dependent protease
MDTTSPAAFAYFVGTALDNGTALAVAKVGAWINLFNLLPFASLDGGRAFNGLANGQRWIAAMTIGVAWHLTQEGLLLLLLIAAVLRALGRGAPRGDARALGEFVVLVAAFSALAVLPVPTGG